MIVLRQELLLSEGKSLRNPLTGAQRLLCVDDGRKSATLIVDSKMIMAEIMEFGCLLTQHQLILRVKPLHYSEQWVFSLILIGAGVQVVVEIVHFSSI